jgi:endonuclease/exonuclease/phosphatase family metal-dependent hydrolase
MAGKEYVFWFDVPNADGPDSRPSASAIKRTTAEVAKIISDEDPDFIFLQEVDDGAKRTDKQNQLTNLLALLPDEYSYHTSAFYWKTRFVPHPMVLGRAGMKLSIVSKHPLSSAKRHQLALTPDNIIATHLGVKRAILEATVPLKEGGVLALLNTHLEAFSKQSDTLEKQVAHVSAILSALDAEDMPWVIGGDFNLLPANQYQTLLPNQQTYYRPNSEIIALTRQYPRIPSEENITKEPKRWFTFYSNDPELKEPDRTLDYLFYSPLLTCTASTIRQHDTIGISDHFPVSATFQSTD